MTKGTAIAAQDATRAVEMETIAGGELLRSTTGLIPANMGQVVELAQLMAKAGPAVPKDFRGHPGLCAAVIFQALHWQANPFSLASLAYVVNDKVAYEAKAIHAAIEAHAGLVDGLDCEYSGEGPTRRILVFGEIRGKARRREYLSPQFKDINPKNSPLWKTDPDQQLWYYGSRGWARKWAPHVLLGIYAPDEIRDMAAAEAGASDVPEVTDAQSGAVTRLLAAKKPKADDAIQIEASDAPPSAKTDETQTMSGDAADTAGGDDQPLEDSPQEQPSAETDEQSESAAGAAAAEEDVIGGAEAEPEAVKEAADDDAPFTMVKQARDEIDRVLKNITRAEDVDAYLEGWDMMVEASFDKNISDELKKEGAKKAQVCRLRIAKSGAAPKRAARRQGD